MKERYSLEDSHPDFKDGEMVEVDMSILHSNLGILSGKVVGKGNIPSLIDTWMIEFGQDFGPDYPYKVVSIPHIAIIK